MEPSGGSGSYLEERFALWRTIDEISKEAKTQTEIIGEMRAKSVKFNLDLNKAHERIRGLMADKDRVTEQLLELKSKLLELKIRSGYIAAGTGAVVAVLIELAKYFWLK